MMFSFFFSSRRRHTRSYGDWSSDVCSSDLFFDLGQIGGGGATWPMFAASACVTLAFAISITRYRLMRLDQLVSSGFMYFVISFVAGMVYYVLVFAGMLLLGSQVGEGEGPS